MDGHRRVTLLPFPSEDETFVEQAKFLLDTVDGSADGPRRLEALLRVEYPHAVVHPQNGLAALDSASEAWYVYRDGRPT